jgi:hypothetical protein
MIRFIFKNLLYVLALLSIVFYYGAYYQYQISQKLLENGVLTEATVVEFVENKSTSGDSGGTSYAPVYEYIDDSNKIIRYKSPESSSFKFVDIGEKVELLYSKQTDQTRINTTWGLYSFMIIFLFLGSAFLTIIIILLKKKNG